MSKINKIRKTTLQKIAKPIVTISLCCVTLMSLQGCVGLLVGGAVVGTLAGSDRRTLGAQTEDKAIIIKGSNRMRQLFGEATHININTFNRRVLLTGEVPDEATKASAEREARAIEGVLGVTNEVQVGFTSSLGSRSNDTLITTKVKASLIDAKDIYANAFHITTEDHVVYLMGRVTQYEGKVGAEVTRGVSGVSKVVKVFEYIDENEAKSSNAAPTKN